MRRRGPRRRAPRRRAAAVAKCATGHCTLLHRVVAERAVANCGVAHLTGRHPAVLHCGVAHLTGRHPAVHTTVSRAVALGFAGLGFRDRRRFLARDRPCRRIRLDRVGVAVRRTRPVGRLVVAGRGGHVVVRRCLRAERCLRAQSDHRRAAGRVDLPGGDQDGGAGGGDLRQQAPQFGLFAGVEAVVHAVQRDDRGPAETGQNQTEEVLLVRRHVAALEVRIEAVQRHRVRLTAGTAEQREPFANVLGDREDRFRSLHIGDVAQRGRTGDRDLARGEPEPSRQGEQHARAPAARRPHHRHQLTRFDRDVEIAEEPTAAHADSRTVRDDHRHRRLL
jgi:hypothetical protein